MNWTLSNTRTCDRFDCDSPCVYHEGLLYSFCSNCLRKANLGPFYTKPKDNDDLIYVQTVAPTNMEPAQKQVAREEDGLFDPVHGPIPLRYQHKAVKKNAHVDTNRELTTYEEFLVQERLAHLRAQAEMGRGSSDKISLKGRRRHGNNAL